MINSEFRALVNKYAILVLIGYSLIFLITTVMQRLLPGVNEVSNSIVLSILASSTWIVQLIVNIVAAVFISKDMKRYEMKNNLIVFITLLFSLLGITMFFITANQVAKDVRN